MAKQVLSNIIGRQISSTTSSTTNTNVFTPTAEQLDLLNSLEDKLSNSNLINVFGAARIKNILSINAKTKSNTSELQSKLLNVNSFSDADIRIFVSDQDDSTLIDNSNIIPNNSIIISSTKNGNSLLCKDDNNVRVVSYKIDPKWFSYNTETNQLTINEEKLNSYINDYIENCILVSDSLSTKKFNISDDWYKYDFETKVNPVETNELYSIYQVEEEKIYSKPIYLTTGTYKLTIYLKASNLTANKCFNIYYYGTNYSIKNLADKISNIVPGFIKSEESSNNITVGNKNYYEYTANIKIENNGLYSFVLAKDISKTPEVLIQK